jgi:uncharacterized protein
MAGSAGEFFRENEEIKLLILRITNDCNLRCRYCYAGGGDNREYMGWETARRAVDYAASRSSFFKIQFTGGEPLLNLPLIEKTVTYVRERKLPAIFQMQTNGTLISLPIARKLKSMGVAIGVSLDGMPEVNDPLRPFAGGRGSTVAVVRGLQNLAAVGIKVGLTAVLTADSAANLPRLVELASYLGNVHGIALDLLRPMGRCLESGVLPPEPDKLRVQILAGLRRAREIAASGGRPVRFREVERLRYQLRRGRARRHYCYATTGQSMVVMPDGAVYPCSSLAGIKDFYPGYITGSDFCLSSAVARLPFLQRTVEDMAECRGCPDNWLCGGGCLARSYAYTGRFDRPYPGDCQLKKVFLEYVRVEEGLFRNEA